MIALHQCLVSINRELRLKWSKNALYAKKCFVTYFHLKILLSSAPKFHRHYSYRGPFHWCIIKFLIDFVASHVYMCAFTLLFRLSQFIVSLSALVVWSRVRPMEGNEKKN